MKKCPPNVLIFCVHFYLNLSQIVEKTILNVSGKVRVNEFNMLTKSLDFSLVPLYLCQMSLISDNYKFYGGKTPAHNVTCLKSYMVAVFIAMVRAEKVHIQIFNLTNCKHDGMDFYLAL